MTNIFWSDCNDSEPAASQDEEFVFCDRLEQEYCELVDMTIEKDVVLYIFSETLSELLQYILFATDLPRIQVSLKRAFFKDWKFKAKIRKFSNYLEPVDLS